jgi:hypothetical protein
LISFRCLSRFLALFGESSAAMSLADTVTRPRDKETVSSPILMYVTVSQFKTKEKIEIPDLGRSTAHIGAYAKSWSLLR